MINNRQSIVPAIGKPRKPCHLHNTNNRGDDKKSLETDKENKQDYNPPQDLNDYYTRIEKANSIFSVDKPYK